jgi:hypothetical protein
MAALRRALQRPGPMLGRQPRGQTLPWAQDVEILERLLLVSTIMDEPIDLTQQTVNGWLRERGRPPVSLTTVKSDRHRVRMLTMACGYANRFERTTDVREGWMRAGVPAMAAATERATAASGRPRFDASGPGTINRLGDSPEESSMEFRGVGEGQALDAARRDKNRKG